MLADSDGARGVMLLATGSEVALAMQGARSLRRGGHCCARGVDAELR